jgi:hypothetical protein
MQLLGIILLLGILILLFVGVVYFGSSQGSSNGRSRSVLDDWDTWHGASNRFAARKKLDKLATGSQRRSRPHKHHPRS